MTEYEKLTLALQAVVAIIAFASLAFLYRQVRVMVDQIIATQEASRAQNAMAIVNFLQSPEVREARHCVRSELSKKHHSSWSDDERSQIKGVRSCNHAPGLTWRSTGARL